MAQGKQTPALTPEEKRKKEAARKRNWRAANLEKSREQANKYKADIRAGRRTIKHRNDSEVVKEKRRKVERDRFRTKYQSKKAEKNQKLIDEYNKKYG